jgi:hypothetical protein
VEFVFRKWFTAGYNESSGSISKHCHIKYSSEQKITNITTSLHGPISSIGSIWYNDKMRHYWALCWIWPQWRLPMLVLVMWYNEFWTCTFFHARTSCWKKMGHVARIEPQPYRFGCQVFNQFSHKRWLKASIQYIGLFLRNIACWDILLQNKQING